MARILVVDDEPDLVMMLEVMLEADGHQVVPANDGARATVLAGEGPCDLVIVDLGLPDVDGPELIARLRKLTGAPVVVLSGRDADAGRAVAIAAGAVDYVSKPFGLEDLLRKVRDLLAGARR